ncbi:MAG: hypothetical protein DMD82_11295, partial [Candidatus Rokuibacteriota bacterium]
MKPPYVRGSLPSPRLRAACACAAFAALAALVLARFAAAAGIDLSWNDCGAAGAQLKTFACNTNSGSSFDLVGSFVPPSGINQLLGMSAELSIASTSLPDWWKHGVGRCRGTDNLTSDFVFTSGACTDFWAKNAIGGYSYVVGGNGPNTAKLIVQCAVSSDLAGPVLSTREYYAFKLHILPTQSTGAGSCAGCSNPVSIALQQVQLFQPPAAANDPVLTAPVVRTVAYWQAPVGTVPVISGFTPVAGAPGDPVRVRGSGLSPAFSVQFNTIDAAFTASSDSTITATIPAGGRSGPIRVATPFGSAASAGSFTVAPAIRYFLPKQAVAGTKISIAGNNFTGSTAVRFGGVATSFSVTTDSTMLALVPSGATTGPLTVTNPGGTATADTLFRVGPTTGAVDLSWDDCGLAGNELKTFACNSNTGTPFTLFGSFVPPPGVSQLAGMTADIGVWATTLPDWWKLGGGQCRPGVSTSVDFRTGSHSCADYWAGLAGSITSYSIGFYGANTARLQVTVATTGTPAPVDPSTQYYGFKVNILRTQTTSDQSCAGCDLPVRLTLHQIQLLQPASAGYDPVLTIPFHSNTAYWQAVPGPLPELHAFAPAGGPPGTPVTVSGLHLTGALFVRFNDTEAAFTVVSDSSIATTVPAGARTGSIGVRTPQGVAASDSMFIVSPVVRSFLPHQAPPGSLVSIVGFNFTRATAVKFNGVAASFGFVADSLLQAIVPGAATTGPISVTNPGGTAVSDSAFRVGPALPGTLNLSWDDCGNAGSQIKTFACNTNSGAPFTLVASFAPPPDVQKLLGMSAAITLNSTDALPDWWQHGSGACRGPAALAASFDFRDAPSSCADVWQGRASGTFSYSVGFLGPNTARLTVSCSVPAATEGPVSSITQYDAFKILIQPTNSTGAGSCAGCAVPVALTLQRLQLLQDPGLGYDPVITAALDRNTAYWQRAPGPLPELRGFTPPGGGPGTAVTIRGAHFTGAWSVRFNPAEAGFTVPSDSVIVATVPPGARTGPIQVTTLQGSGTSDSVFIVAPTIRSFVPRQAPVGFTVVIRGVNFTGVTSVKFHGADAKFDVVSDSTIQTLVPSSATDGPITVTNLGGSATSDSTFHVGPAPAGYIDLAWDDCASGGGGEIKTFACDTNTGSPFTLVASFVPPAGVNQMLALEGDIRIETTASLPDWWKHGSSACRSTSGLSVSVSFTGGPATCADFWAGRATASFGYDIGYFGPSSARLHVSCALPAASAGPVDPYTEYYAFKVSLLRDRTTGAGSCAGCGVPARLTLDRIQLVQPAALAFDPIITAPLVRNAAYWQGVPGPLPEIDRFFPVAGPPGTSVTIRGTTFTGATSVRFNTLDAKFGVMSDSIITALVPLNARTGSIRVSTIQGTATSDSLFIVAPVILSFTPHQAPEGYVISIRGFNFTRTTQVNFKGVTAAFEVTSDSLIRATVPAGATSGPIVVVNPGGSDTSDESFTVGPLLPGLLNIAWDD